MSTSMRYSGYIVRLSGSLYEIAELQICPKGDNRIKLT